MVSMQWIFFFHACYLLVIYSLQTYMKTLLM